MKDLIPPTQQMPREASQPLDWKLQRESSSRAGHRVTLAEGILAGRPWFRITHGANVNGEPFQRFVDSQVLAEEVWAAYQRDEGLPGAWLRQLGLRDAR